MRRYYRLFNIRALFFSFSALLLLASCSSYQYAGYENDGIYSSDRDEAYTANDYEESYEDALYYKQLFAQKSEQFANVPEEGAIFTDIDSYSSGAYDQDFMQEDLDYTVGRAAWGSDPDQISINIYQDPFYRPFFSPYYAGFHDPFWGYPYYNFGFGHPYGYYSSWNFGFGFGWNSWRYGHYAPYWGHHSPFFGGHPYYGGYYYPYYDQRNVAYNTTRRNSYRDYDGYSRTNINTRSSRVESYSNPRNVRAARSTSKYSTDTDDRTYRTRSTRVRSNSSPVRRNSTYSRSSRSSSEVRSVRSTQTRGNNSTRVRSSRSSSGNNSAVRSSSSSSRSSGTTSRSSRGRGN